MFRNMFEYFRKSIDKHLFVLYNSIRTKFGTNIRTSKNGKNFNSNERIGKWSVIRHIKGEFDYEDRKIIQGK